MFSFSHFVYQFFQKRKLVFLLLVLSICAVLGIVASKIKLEEDITRFVPSDKNSQSINSILDNLKSKDKLIIHLYSSDPQKIDEVLEVGDSIHAQLLQKLNIGDYKDVTYTISDDQRQQVFRFSDN